MNGISCDGCGKGLLLDSDVRYVVRIDVRAAYDPLELGREDVERDLAKEIDALLAQMEKADPRALQDQVHRAFRFDLCPECQRAYLRDPLRARPAGGSG